MASLFVSKIDDEPDESDDEETGSRWGEHAGAARWRWRFCRIEASRWSLETRRANESREWNA